MDPLVRAVVDAWLVPGRSPVHHRALQSRLRREWPVLAEAVEKLAAQNPGGSGKTGPGVQA